MSTILTYPGTHADGTPIVFTDLLQDASKTKLLVLGTDTIAVKAQTFIRQRINIDPDEYVSVLFIFVTQPLLVLPELKKLSSNIKHPTHSLHWDLYTTYTVFSISPGNEIISDVINAIELDNGYGAIDAAILFAFSNG